MNIFDTYKFSNNEIRMLEYMIKNDSIAFYRFFFRVKENMKLILNMHHFLIQWALDKTYTSEINRLIITLPPGYGKTEQVIINYVAKGLSINNKSKFIHTSYSGELAHENSSKIKDIIELPEYQFFFPMKIRVDKKGKKKWFNEFGGGIMAAPSLGQITGFRSGTMEKQYKPDLFTGAFLIDDPVKPADIYSKTLKSKANKNFNNTIRSRLAVETVPIILIMQRLDDDDMAGYLLKGNSGDTWYHLSLPAIFDYEYFNKPYNSDYTHGIPLEIDKIITELKTGEKYEFLKK